MTPLILPDGPLVAVPWLVANIYRVVVLDCSVSRQTAPDCTTRYLSGRADYEQQHLPGAGFADLFEGFSAPNAAHPFTAPSAAILTQALQKLGVDQQSRVILYDRLNGAWAARVWYLLRAVYGFHNVRVLDGGFAAWCRLSGPLVSGPEPLRPVGNIRLTTQYPLLVSTDAVRQAQEAGDPPLICALSSEQFRGDADPDARTGHIPGSYSLPYPTILDNEGLIDTAALKRGLALLGLHAESRPLLYCGGGINAAGLALAFAAAGEDPQSLRLYDDSLNGWLSDPGLPLEKGQGRGIFIR